MQNQKDDSTKEREQLLAELTRQMQAEALMRAPLWRRVLAYWIDMTMYAAILIIPIYILESTIMPNVADNYFVLFGLMAGVFALLFVGETLVLNRQSIGKLVMRIRIVSVDGTLIKPGRLFLREMIGRFLLLPITFLQVIVYIFTGGRFIHDLLGKSKVVRLKPSKFMT